MLEKNSFSSPEGESDPRVDVVLREYWYALVRRRRMVGAIAGVAIVAAAIFSFTRTPLYKASAVIQIAPGGNINLLDDRNTIEEVRARYQEFFATQRALLQSRNLADRVMDELQLWDHPLFASQEGDEARRRARQTEKLMNMQTVSAISNTQLLQISYITPAPELSAQLTNALAEEYVLYATESISGVARSTSDFILEQIRKLRRQIKENEKLLQDYSQRDDLIGFDQSEKIDAQQVEQMNRQLSQVEAELAEASARYRSLEQADVDSIPEILSNRTIQDLKREQAELQQHYTDLSAKFKPSYPEVRRTRTALEETEKRLNEETNEIARKVIGAAQVRYETALRRRAILNQALEQQRQEVRDRNVITSDFRGVKVELDNQRAILEQLLRRQSDTRLSAELGVRRSSMAVQVVDEAVVPTARHYPKHRVNLLMGAFVGLALGIGVAIFLHHRDALLDTEQDIGRHAGLSFLGAVSHEHSTHTDAGGAPVNADGEQYGLDSTYEQAKFLALLLVGRDTPPKSILISSSTSEEGKTFVASQFANCVAHLNKKVLLVDANLRNPRLHDVYGKPEKSGLRNVLTNGAQSYRDFIQSTSVPNLSVMLAGTGDASPAELLGSEAMKNLLQKCAEEYDHIVLDSAPLLPVVDSHVLIRQCDAVILVKRSGSTSRQTVETTKELISNEDGKIAGVVLNDIGVGAAQKKDSDEARSETSMAEATETEFVTSAEGSQS